MLHPKPEKLVNIENFWQELKRRKVIRVTLVYLAASFAILEASEMIFPRLGLPDWTITFVMLLLFVGFILVIVLSWVYDITPEGIRITDSTDIAGKAKYSGNLTGKTISHYKITEKIGEGTLGVIYKTEDTALKRTVALTFLSDWICADKAVRARLIEKAQAAAGIIRPDKTTIFSVEEVEGRLFIVMEYIRDQSLKDSIPAELEAIIIESIKERPEIRYHDIERKPGEPEVIKDSPEPGDGLESLPHHAQLLRGLHKEFPGITYKPSLLQFITSKKVAFPIIIVAAVIIISLNWESIKQKVGPGDSKRELAKVHVKNAVSYYNLGELEPAKQELELALEIDPKYSYAWSTLAAVSINQDNLDQAILQTIEAIELDPANSGAAYNLAYALDDKKDYHQAIEWYSKAIEIDSTLVPAYSALGRVYNILNQPVDAILVLNKAMRGYPESEYLFVIYKNLGNSYLLLEQYGESIKHLKLSRDLNQYIPETNLYLAKAYEASGDMNKSIEMWQVYIDVETDTLKIQEAQEHLKEITIIHLQEIIQ